MSGNDENHRKTEFAKRLEKMFGDQKQPTNKTLPRKSSVSSIIEQTSSVVKTARQKANSFAESVSTTASNTSQAALKKFSSGAKDARNTANEFLTTAKQSFDRARGNSLIDADSYETVINDIMTPKYSKHSLIRKQITLEFDKNDQKLFKQFFPKVLLGNVILQNLSDNRKAYFLDKHGKQELLCTLEPELCYEPTNDEYELIRAFSERNPIDTKVDEKLAVKFCVLLLTARANEKLEATRKLMVVDNMLIKLITSIREYPEIIQQFTIAHNQGASVFSDPDTRDAVNERLLQISRDLIGVGENPSKLTGYEESVLKEFAAKIYESIQEQKFSDDIIDEAFVNNMPEFLKIVGDLINARLPKDDEDPAIVLIRSLQPTGMQHSPKQNVATKQQSSMSQQPSNDGKPPIPRRPENSKGNKPPG